MDFCSDQRVLWWVLRKLEVGFCLCGRLTFVCFEVDFLFRSKSTFVGLESWVFICEEGISNSHQRLYFWCVLKFRSKHSSCGFERIETLLVVLVGKS